MHPQFDGQVCKKLSFLELFKKRKMANFKSKSLCDESLKIEIRRWQFSCIFRYRCCGILRFFGRRRFQGEICWSKSPNLQIFKKEEKLAFLYGKIRPSIMIFLLFFLSIFLAHPRATLCTPELWSGTHNEDFQRWSPIDHKWSFSIISSKNHFFSPIKIWSKWSLKIAPKPSVLRKKLIKATLKYIDWRAFCTYWLWSGCWGSARNLAAKIVKICVFLNFWKNEKWLTLNRKISVTKVQK